MDYFTVTGSVIAVIADSSDDEGGTPEEQNVSGLVMFTPSVREVVVADPPTIVRLQPIQARLEEDGQLYTLDGSAVELLANSDAIGPLESLTYKVEFSNVVYDKLKNQRIEPFRFEAPTTETTIDLATVTRLPL